MHIYELLSLQLVISCSLDRLRKGGALAIEGAYNYVWTWAWQGGNDRLKCRGSKNSPNQENVKAKYGTNLSY